MDNARRIEEWNARWMIVAGRALFIGCSESQALNDCESQFSHARTCDSDNEEPERPWIELHDILDRARE